MPPDSGQQLLNKEGQQRPADDGEEVVVDNKQGFELERRKVLHDLAATKDDSVIGDQHGGSLIEGGHGSDTLDELELAGGIAHDELEGLVEDGP